MEKLKIKKIIRFVRKVIILIQSEMIVTKHTTVEVQYITNKTKTFLRNKPILPHLSFITSVNMIVIHSSTNLIDKEKTK